MEVIELSATEQEEIYRIVASVLHLGNAGFGEEEGRARLTNSMAVHTVAKVGYLVTQHWFITFSILEQYSNVSRKV